MKQGLQKRRGPRFWGQSDTKNKTGLRTLGQQRSIPSRPTTAGEPPEQIFGSGVPDRDR